MSELQVAPQQLENAMPRQTSRKDHANPLRVRLKQLRRRLVMLGAATGIVTGFAGVVAVLLVGAWLDLLWELSPALRLAAIIAACIACLVLFGVILVRAFRAGRDTAIARRLDRSGELGGQIVTAVELDGPLPEAFRDHAPELSSGLATMAVRRAAELAAQVPAAKAVPVRPLKRSAGLFGAELACVAILAICLPGLARTQWNRFLHPYDDVPPYSSIEFEVEPGDKDVVYGEQLDIYARVLGGAVDRVEVVLGDLDEPREVLPMFLEPDGRWRGALAKVVEPGTYCVRVHRARSPQYRIGVITVPRIENVRFRIEPPQYTQVGVSQGAMPKGGIAGLPGTKVQVWAESNRPLSGGTLAIPGLGKPTTVSLVPTESGSHEASAEFIVTRDGKFTLHVTDVAGQSSREPFVGAITLLADQRPFLRILKPEPMALATPNAMLPVVVTAEDDYGVSRVQLFRSLNESRPSPANAALPALPPRRVYETIQLPLAEYGLSPGDVIKLFGRAEDNDPGGAKGAESPPVTVRIISQEEFERMLRVRQGLEVLASKYQEARRRTEGLVKEIEELRKKLEQLPPEGRASREMRDELKRLAERLRKESEAIHSLTSRKLPYDLDKNLNDQLAELARAVESGASLLDEAGKEPDADHRLLAEKMRKLLEKLGAGQQKFDKEAMQPIEHLNRIFPLLEDASRFLAIAARQEDLADRMASLKGRDGADDPALKARMRDLEEEERKIREDLASLLGDIENHLEQLPDDPQFDKLRQTAARFVKGVRASGASEAMTQAETALSEFAGTKAHEKAKEAAEILKRFIKFCEPGEGGMPDEGMACLVFQPTLAKGLGQTVGQLLRDMGLPGFENSGGGGMGYGRGGYSARRGPNVGLYGSLPGMKGSEGSGSGQQRNAAGTGQDRGEARGGVNPDVASPAEAANRDTTAGGIDSSVPNQYRRRVGQYFQRIADEARKGR